MIIIKFIVLFGFISVLSALQTYYCEICSNHTLCQYKIPGPSAACVSYDSAALLSSQDIKELVNKINERRNFVAMGHSKVMPQAANMKKINWSSELAITAQRWADQCDPYLNPDREDACRDLKNVKVGQTIASVAGPSPGLNLKCFVEMWFIQILDYAGTVTYYNQSRDHNSNYFTQLIWAETEFVGCGKVKFYLHERKVMIERLVCNFAPKGNIHGKSVYAIGYPGTQCAVNMNTKDDYKGLCDYADPPLLRKLTSQRPPVDSLLKILNLSDGHDTLSNRNNLEHVNLKRKRQRNQNPRHITAMNNNDAVRHAPIHKQNIKKSHIIHNMSRSINDDEHHYRHERGHSHMYRGYQQPTSRKPTMYATKHFFQGNNNQEFRKYDYTSPSIYFISSPDYRKYQPYQQCTRKTGQKNNNCCNSYLCTRGQCLCQHTPNACHSETFTNPTLPNNLCPYPIHTICPTVCPTMCPLPYTTADNCICQCAQNDVSYNNIPNMLRSGNHKTKDEFTASKKESGQVYVTKISKIINENEKTNLFHDEIEDEIHPQYNEQDRDYLYRSFEATIRIKRQNKDQITLKPFWKMNEWSHNKKTPDLRALKYTTLTNRKNRKTKKNMRSIFRSFTTESITINKEEYADDDVETQKSEKYLSFDELMYLRKFSDNPRRAFRRKNKNKSNSTSKSGNSTTKGKASNSTSSKGNSTGKTTAKTTAASKETTTKATTKSTTTPTTTEATTSNIAEQYTILTTYIPKKHCTRKITCTWTAYTGTGDDANKNIGPKEFGSRTPPGYVEGCTRTATCTRDFFERNKESIETNKTGKFIDGEGSGEDDEDAEYCEKRSLKVRRHNLVQNESRNSYTHKACAVLLNSSIKNMTGHCSYNCCDRHVRMKRHESTLTKGDSRIMSYADLYYLVLNKIIKTYEEGPNRTNNCLCNCTGTQTSFSFIIFYVVLNYINYNRCCA